MKAQCYVSLHCKDPPHKQDDNSCRRRYHARPVCRKGQGKGHSTGSIAHMRGELASARRMIGEAKVEPPFLATYRWKPEELMPVLNAMDSVIMSCAAMESLLEGKL